MMLARWIAAVQLALVPAVAEAASPDAWPDCRTGIQELLATNTLAFWASEENGVLQYVMRIDAERWDDMGADGQDGLEALLSCSISAGGEPVPYTLSVRSAYSNRELARYRNGERLPSD
ncbi:MAG: hypothetical protein OXI73_06030 [Rhodospirillales bacterium]|nr:hypothetical protein [Rhodospirillales bacterium]MCY3854794.1 hypothetical protein [Rhodospirillales bacterium]MCY4002268.1 hypothetical protein [Rhodospirillales bacterium]MDE0372088.1 hypothetical protein [Rhodospirillales bacterium]